MSTSGRQYGASGWLRLPTCASCTCGCHARQLCQPTTGHCQPCMEAFLLALFVRHLPELPPDCCMLLLVASCRMQDNTWQWVKGVHVLRVPLLMVCCLQDAHLLVHHRQLHCTARAGGLLLLGAPLHCTAVGGQGGRVGFACGRCSGLRGCWGGAAPCPAATCSVAAAGCIVVGQHASRDAAFHLTRHLQGTTGTVSALITTAEPHGSSWQQLRLLGCLVLA